MGFTRMSAPGGTAQHLAEFCKDELCPRLPCRMFKSGYEKGYQDGYAVGYAAGYSAGFGAGFSSGVASAAGSG
ncbi:MAG TPA: hypothetical protein VME44_25825 [Streptosporangiaceae bacterium]|nr:hypothetical protein [Streptosporangiaceae bacterium]